MYNTHQKILIALLGLGMLGAIIAFIAGLYNGRNMTTQVMLNHNFVPTYVSSTTPYWTTTPNN